MRDEQDRGPAPEPAPVSQKMKKAVVAPEAGAARSLYVLDNRVSR